jgi:hypothetical protein
MYQIAIGDDVSFGGYTVVQGDSVTAPFKSANYAPVFQIGAVIQDQILLRLAGTASQLSTALTTLETIKQRITLFNNNAYPSPQFLRFKVSSSASYYYARLESLELEVNKDAPHTRQTGSLTVNLNFTRPNYFDGPQTALPLTGAGGTDVTAGLAIFNHTDSGAGHGNWIAVDPDDVDSDLPAPLRIELTNNYGTSKLHDTFISLYNHPYYQSYSPFFYYPSSFVGGSMTANANAISGYYRTVTGAAAAWRNLGNWTLAASNIKAMSGAAFRPVLRFYNSFAYTDLYMRIVLRMGYFEILLTDPIFCDPNYGYAIFPPLKFPPGRISWLYDPSGVSMHLYAYRDSGAISLDWDCLTLLPLHKAAFFKSFYEMVTNTVLLDDSFLNIHSSDLSPAGAGAEIVCHIRSGDPLVVSPVDKTLILILMEDALEQLAPARTATVKAFYRPRKRVL